MRRLMFSLPIHSERSAACPYDTPLRDCTELVRVTDKLHAVMRLQRQLLDCQDEGELGEALCEALVAEFGAYLARVWFVQRLDQGHAEQAPEQPSDPSSCRHLVACRSRVELPPQQQGEIPVGYFDISEVVSTGNKVVSNDVANDRRIVDRKWVLGEDLQGFAGLPLVRDGQVVGVMAMYSKSALGNHDVTTLELVAEIVSGAFHRLEAAQLQVQLADAHRLEAIGRLAAGIAHEINTPMQCVGNNVEFLRECYARLFDAVDHCWKNLHAPEQSWQVRSDNMKELLERIRYESIRVETPLAIEEAAMAVQRVIEIVRATKYMTHSATKSFAVTDVNELIRNAVTITRNSWKYVAELESDLEDGLPTTSVLNGELTQVLVNLIVNAADAIAESRDVTNDGMGRISIRTATVDEGIQIDVADDGGGIPEHIKLRMFDMFYTTKDVGKGTGQGLALVYDVVVKHHQGRIAVDTEVGAGTTFSIWIPLKCDEEQCESETTELPCAPAAP